MAPAAAAEGSSTVEKKWVTLISKDGFAFVLDYNVATCTGGTIKNILASDPDSGAGGTGTGGGGFAEAQTQTISLNVRASVLDVIVKYLHWYSQYSLARDWDAPDFKKSIPVELALEV
ncbi:Transcription elongation factor B (SIII), polypeptide 1 (15kDa, elongin C) [Tilletia horrida]|uniref:Transcription elongation factor B (SIII), polypeptide 1 (15kDa, elongin C) n=1 Tax=Tilletia horrida TaxID=155126 RepID=A0AAN6GTT2_9BASI|nr:Transcription elongation factor B (SIII), polypeptide 1 (15kDa, elongin C) [Tilletia horrida]